MNFDSDMVTQLLTIYPHCRQNYLYKTQDNTGTVRSSDSVSLQEIFVMTKFLKMQNFMLLLVGYNRKEPEHFGWKIYTYVNLCLLIVIIWPEMSYVTANISDVKMATDGLCPLLFGASSLAKLLTMRIKKPQFYKLIRNLQDLWEEGKIRNAQIEMN